MIDHARLRELMEQGAALIGEGPGLGGRIEPGCLVVESGRMARTFASLGVTHAGANLSREDLCLVERSLQEALLAGMAMMVAHYESELERLRADRERPPSLVTPRLGDGRPRAV